MRDASQDGPIAPQGDRGLPTSWAISSARNRRIALHSISGRLPLIPQNVRCRCGSMVAHLRAAQVRFRGNSGERLPPTATWQVVTAPRSPWQNPYVECLIGPIRRECLDHIIIIIFNEHHLRGVLSRYFQYHHKTRTHLSLIKDCPEPRRIQPRSAGKIIAFPEVGGLHHRHERRAA